MIMRNLERKPLRAAITVAGIAGSVAILISGTFWSDAIDWFMDVQFNKVQRAQRAASASPSRCRATARFELERLPGVKQVEVTRAIAVRLRAGHRSYRTAITGVADDARAAAHPRRSSCASARPRRAACCSPRASPRRLGVRRATRCVAELLEGKRVQGRAARRRHGATSSPA